MELSEIMFELKVIREQAKRHIISTLVKGTIHSDVPLASVLAQINQIYCQTGLPKQIMRDDEDLGDQQREARQRARNLAEPTE